MQQLVDEASVNAVFAEPRYLLLKHSPICPISDGVRLEIQTFESEHPGLPVGLIDVIEGRALSDAVAMRTGIRHESPQALLLENGKVVWHENHWRVTATRVADALARLGA